LSPIILFKKKTDTRLSQFNSKTIDGKPRQNKLFKELLTLKNKNTSFQALSCHQQVVYTEKMANLITAKR